MEELSNQTCEACRAGAPTISDQDVPKLMKQIPRWDLIQIEGVNRLKRTYSFKNFKEALNFTMHVGQLAEAENHHPTLETSWGEVSVSWWTHKINGLHLNDFIMAAKTDELIK